jgi:hypothetical protein
MSVGPVSFGAAANASSSARPTPSSPTLGQIAREIVVSDWGPDMEVEFKDDNYHPSGRRVWLSSPATPTSATADATTPTSSGSTKATPCVRRWRQKALDLPTHETPALP